MKKLSKEQMEIRGELIEALKEAEGTVNELIEAANRKIEDANEAINDANGALSDLNNAIDTLNAKIAEAETWGSEISSEIGDYMDERSDKWQESEKADNYRSWKEPFESLTTDSIEHIEDFPEIEKLEEITSGSDLVAELEDTNDEVE